MNKPYKIAVIDYRMSNMFSIKNALTVLGFDVEVTSDYSTIVSCDGAILPGVGSFPEAIKNIKELKIHLAIESVMELIRSINKYLEVKEPWKSLKEDSKNQNGLNALSVSCEAIALSAKLLYPVMPKKCEEIFSILGVEKESINNLDFETISGNSINPHKALFPRIENDD